MTRAEAGWIAETPHSRHRLRGTTRPIRLCFWVGPKTNYIVGSKIGKERNNKGFVTRSEGINSTYTATSVRGCRFRLNHTWNPLRVVSLGKWTYIIHGIECFVYLYSAHAGSVNEAMATSRPPRCVWN